MLDQLSLKPELLIPSLSILGLFFISYIPPYRAHILIIVYCVLFPELVPAHLWAFHMRFILPSLLCTSDKVQCALYTQPNSPLPWV